MKKFNFILLSAGLVFLTYLICTTGPWKLCRQVWSLGLGLVPFIFAEGVAEMIHTVGWRYCLNEPHRSISWWRLFQIRMSGYAVNYLTPTASMGGEVTKIALLAAQHRGPQAVSGVVIEKVSFAIAQVLFVAAGCWFVVRYASLPRPLWVGMLFGTALVAGGIMIFMLLQKGGKLGGFIRWLDSRKDSSHTLRTAAIKISAVDDALRAFYRDRRVDLWGAISWHVAGCSIGVIQTWLFFQLLGQGKSWPIAAAAWTLAMWFDLLTFMVPLGVGSLEGSRVVTLRAVGFNALSGLTYGIAVRLSQLFWSGVGLLLYGALVLREGRTMRRTVAAVRKKRQGGEGGGLESVFGRHLGDHSLKTTAQESEVPKLQSKEVPI